MFCICKLTQDHNYGHTLHRSSVKLFIVFLPKYFVVHRASMRKRTARRDSSGARVRLVSLYGME